MAFGKLVVATAGLGAAYLALSGSKGGGGQSFAQPTGTVVERLTHERRVVEGTGLGSLTIANLGTEDGVVRLRVSKAGDPHGVTCRVAVSPVSAGQSRTVVDCLQPATKDKPMGRLGADALALVVREHVAATVEGRAYDVDGVANGMLAFVVFHRPAIAASLKD